MPMKRKPLPVGRVPVSTAGEPSHQLPFNPRPVGLNKRHEDHLVSFLEAHYGWHLGTDGNLYSPHCRHAQEGGNAA